MIAMINPAQRYTKSFSAAKNPRYTRGPIQIVDRVKTTDEKTYIFTAHCLYKNNPMEATMLAANIGAAAINITSVVVDISVLRELDKYCWISLGKRLLKLSENNKINRADAQPSNKAILSAVLELARCI